MLPAEREQAEREVAEGGEAERKLAILGPLFDELEEKLVEKWKRTLPGDAEILSATKYAQHGLAAVRSLLTGRIQTGKLAEIALTDAEKAKGGGAGSR